jgi:hypothetical protein
VKKWPSTFLIDFRSPDSHLTWNGRNIPFVNDVKYLGVVFDKRITWNHHIEMTEESTASPKVDV